MQAPKVEELRVVQTFFRLVGTDIRLKVDCTLYGHGNSLKGQCHKIFCFFLVSVSPKPLIIPSGPFQIFSKIRGDICSSRFATGVNDTGGNWKKSSI
jgi:hypothetical protein